jgi:hypothetical protein
MPRKCIALHAAGGPGFDRAVPEGHVSIQCRCYGATAVEAWAVATAMIGGIHRAHHQEPVSGQMLLTVMVSSHPADFIEPVVEWPGVMFNLDVHYVTDAIS